MVLVVGVVILDHDIKDGTRVRDGHLGFLWVGSLDDVVLRERRGKDAPDAVRVQLQWTANLRMKQSGKHF